MTVNTEFLKNFGKEGVVYAKLAYKVGVSQATLSRVLTVKEVLG